MDNTDIAIEYAEKCIAHYNALNNNKELLGKIENSLKKFMFYMYEEWQEMGIFDNIVEGIKPAIKGFNDEEGIPYIMQSVVPKGIFDRDRLIVFYTKDLQRYIIPIDGENYTLVGNGIPENVQNINYGKAKK